MFKMAIKIFSRAGLRVKATDENAYADGEQTAQVLNLDVPL